MGFLNGGLTELDRDPNQYLLVKWLELLAGETKETSTNKLLEKERRDPGAFPALSALPASQAEFALGTGFRWRL